MRRERPTEGSFNDNLVGSELDGDSDDLDKLEALDEGTSFGWEVAFSKLRTSIL